MMENKTIKYVIILLSQILYTYISIKAPYLQALIFQSDLGKVTTPLWLHILIFVLLDAFTYLIYKKYIKKDNKNPHKANIFIRIWNKIYYPRFLIYEGFIWKVSKDDQNFPNVHPTPFCIECKRLFKIEKQGIMPYLKCPICGDIKEVNTFINSHFQQEEMNITNSIIYEGIKVFKHSKNIKKLKHNN